MKKLYLILWWHMHQPMYKNPFTGTYELPWVFLHSIKDYLEMPLLLERFNKLKMNFNLTPVLIDQIEDYQKSDTSCKLLNAIKKSPSDMEEEERKFLFYLTDIMTDRLKDRAPLLREIKKENTSPEVLRDIQVSILIAWLGEETGNRKEVIKAIKEKDRHFTEEEKNILLEELKDITGEIIPIYRKLQEEGRISVTSSPYYHPILPLLFNMHSAREVTENITLPEAGTDTGEDALAHLDKAVDRYAEIMDRAPESFWPSEGAVSNKVLEAFYEKGIRICATDETVLENTNGSKDIYKPYVFRGGINILFRHRELSDKIGFVYYHWREEDAVSDFVITLRHIYENYENPVVTIILDGENCWEYYPDNGNRFINMLYETLEREEWVETLTLRELLEKGLMHGELSYIKAGSWINGNFLKWIGHPEKNKFWNMLLKTRKMTGLNRSIMVAEGSDWFWWQGETDSAPFLDVFKHLFVQYLKDACLSSGTEIPDFLEIK